MGIHNKLLRSSLPEDCNNATRDVSPSDSLKQLAASVITKNQNISSSLFQNSIQQVAGCIDSKDKTDLLWTLSVQERISDRISGKIGLPLSQKDGETYLRILHESIKRKQVMH
jgi:hypothetical protein